MSSLALVAARVRKMVPYACSVPSVASLKNFSGYEVWLLAINV